jgi:two-component system NtrC family sensor kinase
MKKAGVLLFIFSCLWSAAFSQTKLSPVVLISDTIEGFLLDSTQLMIYADKKGNKGIKEIAAIPGQFNIARSGFVTDNADAGAFWLHYQLKNSADHPLNISIGNQADSVFTYLLPQDSGKAIQQFLSGSAVSWSKKDGLKESDVIPFQIDGKQTVDVYQRLKNQPKHKPGPVVVGVFSTQKLIQSEFIQKQNDVISISHYGNIFFAGFFLLASLFNLLLFKVTREREYFLLAGFLFFLFAQMNPWFTTILSRENQWLSEKISDASLLYIVFLFQFVRHFFKTKMRLKKWDRLLYITNLLLTLSIVMEVFLVANSTLELTRSVIFVGANAVYVATLFYLFRLPGREKKLFAGAMMPFLLSFVSLFIVAIIYIFFSVTGNTSLDLFFEWVGEWAYLVNNIAISWAVLYFAHILFKRYESQKKAIAMQELEKEQERNALIAAQKIELENQVSLRTAELQESLVKLTKTQNQLIHAEKMAALGQLTSGIAHEIQNPLNFVTNFSEVNEELIEEVRLGWKNGDEALVDELIHDINENTRKINFHSKRADAIVKGMMLHAQTGKNEKEYTEINPLCEEMLRISYQTARSKNKILNVKVNTEYDPQAGEIFIYPKELSRVLLNIFNNAFYALSEKLVMSENKIDALSVPYIKGETIHSAPDQQIIGDIASHVYQSATGNTQRQKTTADNMRYEPVIWISTRRLENVLEIRIKDNGTGISPEHTGKIFQPFFTTKPTGSGTGLGLSLAYEIVTRGHGGELLVSSELQEYSEFIIRLPF